MNANLIATVFAVILLGILIVCAVPAAIAIWKERRRSIPRVDRYLARQ